MALASLTTFEVRPSVGSDTACGGGFVTGASGTDWSKQNAAQYSLTGLITTGASATILTTAASSDMVGNIIQINAGTNFTVGFYQIMSVVAGTSITVDRNATTGVGASGAGAIGGALATISQAVSIAVAGNTIYIKSTGTYTVSSAQAISLDSSAVPGAPLSFIGYTTTRGDNGQITWTTSTNSINLVEFAAARNILFQNIIFSSTAGTPGSGFIAKSSNNSFQIYAINCKFSGFSVGIDGDWNIVFAFIELVLSNCRVTGCTSHGVRNSGSTVIFGCDIDNNGADGANWTGGTPATSAGWAISFSKFYKNANNGLNITFTFLSQTTGPFVSITNSDFSTNTGAGILVGSSSCPTIMAYNNIFDANGTYGVDGGSSNSIAPFLLYNNAFYNNTTAATRAFSTGLNAITLTANPYTSIGTDFSLNSTSGGGALLKGAGFPGVTALGTGHLDVGAVQSSGTGGNANIGIGVADLIWFAD